MKQEVRFVREEHRQRKKLNLWWLTTYLWRATRIKRMYGKRCATCYALIKFCDIIRIIIRQLNNIT